MVWATFIRTILSASLGFKQLGLRRPITWLSREQRIHLLFMKSRVSRSRHEPRRAEALTHTRGSGSDGGGPGGRTNSRTRVLLLSVPRGNLLEGDIPPQCSLRRCFGPWMEEAQGAVPGSLRGGGLRAVCARSCSRRHQGLEIFLFLFFSRNLLLLLPRDQNSWGDWSRL